MSLPKIELDTLPNLDNASGVFGSMSDVATVSADDRVVIIMVYIYENG